MADEVARRDQGQLATRRRDPFLSLREEMDRLFDSFLSGFPTGFPTFGRVPSLRSDGEFLVPSVDVRESDREVVIEADLPGIDEKDISVTLQDGVLTLRGEKKAETKEERENYHLMERSYGSFQRSLRLPDTVDEDKVEARFDKGVLKITMPKRPDAISRQKRIEIKSGS